MRATGKHFEQAPQGECDGPLTISWLDDGLMSIMVEHNAHLQALIVSEFSAAAIFGGLALMLEIPLQAGVMRAIKFAKADPSFQVVLGAGLGPADAPPPTRANITAALDAVDQLIAATFTPTAPSPICLPVEFAVQLATIRSCLQTLLALCVNPADVRGGDQSPRQPR